MTFVVFSESHRVFYTCLHPPIDELSPPAGVSVQVTNVENNDFEPKCAIPQLYSHYNTL